MGTAQPFVSVAPASFPGLWSMLYSSLVDVFFVFFVPVFEPSFPAPGLPTGADMQQISGQFE